MHIKIDKADRVFSQFIRARDKRCCRCLSPVTYNAQGHPNSHTTSHFFGRGRENTRFDPANCDTLCLGCHRYWGSDNYEDYRNFKIKQLGPDKFNNLVIRANMTKRKDRKASLIHAKSLLSEPFKELSDNQKEHQP